MKCKEVWALASCSEQAVRPRSSRWSSTLLLVALLTTLTSSSLHAETGTFWTTSALLKDFWKTSDKVSFVTLPAAAPGKKADVVYVARSGGVVDGYSVVLDEIGQHEPITFGVQFDAAGLVRRVEVMAYREAYGHEIRSARFLAQFVGPKKEAADVDAISGASLSCRSATRAVARALTLVARARAQTATTTTTAPTTTAAP